MPVVQVPHNWRPRSYQMPLWRYLERGGTRAIAVWHRRAGKDEVPLHFTACQAIERVGSYWHMLPEQNQARKAIWNAVNPHSGRRRIDEAFPLEIRGNTRDDEMLIRFKSGSTWQVVGSDNYNSLVGSSPRGIVFSEWALANPAAWAFIRPILLENGGWAIFNGTPRGRNHLHTMVKGAENDDRWFTQCLRADQTGVFSAEQLAQELAEYQREYGHDIGQNLFDQEYMVSFDAAILGAYYGRELRDAEQSGRVGDVPPSAAPVHTAWDLGIGDSTAIWWWQMVGSEIRVLDFYEAHGQGLPHYAEIIKAKPWERGADYVPHDATVRELGTGRTRVETMRALGLNPRLVANHRIEDGRSAVRTTLPRCWFNKATTADAIEGLKQYRAEWDEANRCFKDSAKHDWTSHRADAFRYLCMAWREAAREETREAGRRIAVGSANSATFNDLWDDRPRRQRI